MACYLLRGENGVIIHYNFYRAEDCKRYIRKGRIKKYECFEEAEAAALEHLENIVPYYIQIPDAVLKFYCFCGFDRNDKWDDAFWVQDIKDLFTRIHILMQNRCLPYVMRFNRYVESPYRGMYVTIARWCNQPNFFKKKTFREFVEINGETSAAARYAREFELKHPECAAFFEMRFPTSSEEV